MAQLNNVKTQLVYEVSDGVYERVNPLTIADIVQMEESESTTADNILNYISRQMATKADKATTLAGYGITDAYTKTETGALLDNKADKATTLSGYGITDAYTKTETDTLIENKADKATTLSGYGITDAYTKSESNTLLNNKADKATTLSGYGITDAYTKTETGTLIENKADKATTLSGYGITDAYTKSEVDQKISEITKFHVEVVAELPEVGQENILYLVPKTGSEKDVYEEYIWVVVEGVGRYEFLGTTAVDLTNYYKKSEVDALLLTKQNDLELSTEGTTAVKTITSQDNRVGQVVDGTWKHYMIDGEVALPSQTGNDGKYLKTNGTTASWEYALPSQAGFAGKVLKTDGTNATWGTEIPDQVGNSGKVLKTDGSTISWGNAYPVITGNEGKALLNNGNTILWDSINFTANGTLTASGWNTTTKSQEITLTGMKIDDMVIITPTPTNNGSNEKIYSNAGIRGVEQSNDKIVFYCDTIPTSDVSVLFGVSKIRNYINVTLTVDQDNATIETFSE